MQLQAALLLVLVYALDGATTLAALARGGVETNPLVAGLGPAPYVAACALRAAVAVALLLGARRARRPVAATIRLGLAALVVAKLAAAANNLAWLGAPGG